MTATLLSRATAGRLIAAIIVGVSTGCSDAADTPLRRFSEARHLAAELLVQFTKAADASNRAVMADTDETSVAFARESEQATQAVQGHVDSLKPMLEAFGYSNETRLLSEFSTRFSEYRALDRSILDLAIENTNIKAQQLSFGPAQDATDAFRQSIEAVATSAAAGDAWRVKALVATALSAVREIQVLQAPHIAEADETAMTRMERRMRTEETVVRNALETLSSLVKPASRPLLADAGTALGRFMSVNAEIVALSRRNTNVRSLALSLRDKRRLTVACEESLRAIHDALAKRVSTATR